MKVFKFGGASIKSAEAVRNIARIIQNFSDQKELLVVVSAMGKTTNALEAVLNAYHSGTSYYEQALAEVRTYHLDIIQDLFPDKDSPIYAQFDNLMLGLLKKLRSGVKDPEQLYDQVVSYGELLSSQIIASFLNQEGLYAQFIDSRQYIKTDENWKEGIVDFDWSERLIQNELKDILMQKIAVTQGFIGGTISNQTTTLGREGSDYSAAIFASCLPAESVTIWKDVPGILNADPKRISNTKLYERLSYKDAAEITYFGASVIHPKTIRPLAIKNIPLYVKSFIVPENRGTTIGNFEETNHEPAIIFKLKQSLVKFEEKDYLNVNKGHLGHVFHELSQLNVKMNLIRRSAISFTVCCNTDPIKFDKVKAIFGDQFHIKITDGLELVTVKNYDEESVQSIKNDEPVFMEQKTPHTYQVVRASKFEGK